MRPRSLAPTRSNHTVEIRLQLRARTFRQMLEHVLYPSCGTLHVAKIAGPGIRARRSGLSNHLCPLRRGHLQTASARFAYGTSTYVRDIYILVTTAHAGIQAGASRPAYRAGDAICRSREKCQPFHVKHISLRGRRTRGRSPSVFYDALLIRGEFV